jgi:prepilin-type processing-associated H-X9-DG protein
MVEVLVVVAVLTIIAAILLPALAITKYKTSKLGCVTCLKQIGLAYRIWAQDNNDKYPMQVSVTNGGAMELIATGNVAACFQVMSNQLSTPKILICPTDTNRIAATNFAIGFNNDNISYFVGLDADLNHPQMFLSGDDNFAVGGVPVKSGLLQLSTHTPVAWTSLRHVAYDSHFWTPARGNILFVDGSVQQLTTKGLQQALQQTGVATNRLAIP